MSCPSPDWSQHNNACIRLVSDEATWSIAKSSCQEQGAFLATILTADENSFVASLLREGGKTSAWIGVNDHVTQDHYVWVDGSPIAFTNWSGGTPPTDANKNFGRIDDRGAWLTDLDQFISWPYVCKYVSPMETPPSGAYYSQLYTSTHGKVLVNHIFSHKKRVTILECAGLCLVDRRCLSFNFKPQGGTQMGLCQMNDAITVEHPADVFDDAESTYAEPSQYTTTVRASRI